MENHRVMALGLAGLALLCLWRGLRGLLSGSVAGQDRGKVEASDEPLHYAMVCLMWIGGAVVFAIWAWTIWRG